MSFNAKYRGDCRDCDEPVLPGQEVEFDDERNLLHVVCPENIHATPRQVCPRCFLEMSVTGVCGYCDD